MDGIIKIEANRTLRDLYQERLRRGSTRERISVIDLLNPKRAYYTRKRPDVKIPLERKQKMVAGSGFHEEFESAVAPEAYREQLVEREGIVGKIDIYEDLPVELKTTSYPISGEEIIARRGEYLEQLGMYCAMTDKEEGRLILYCRSENLLKAFDVSFQNLPVILSEMLIRKERIERAISENKPEILPRCPYWKSGCEYERICDCETSEPLDYRIANLCERVEEKEEIAKLLLEKIAESRRFPEREKFSFHELVNPRKTYFERIFGRRKEELVRMERRGMKKELEEILFCGDGIRRIAENQNVRGWVLIHLGTPTILAISKLARVVDREKLPVYFPYHLSRLELECSALHERKGRFLIFYSNVEKDAEKLQSYDVYFSGKDLDESAEKLREAVTQRKLGILDKCPEWMCRDCEYKESCDIKNK